MSMLDNDVFDGEVEEFGIWKLFMKASKEAIEKHYRDVRLLRGQRKLYATCLIAMSIGVLSGLACFPVTGTIEDPDSLPPVARIVFYVSGSFVALMAFSIILLKCMTQDAKQRLVVWYMAEMALKIKDGGFDES